MQNLLNRLYSYHLDVDMPLVAYATEQIIDLYANGIRAVHVYSMNKPEVARAIRGNLSEII